MPTDLSILGFANPWYPLAMRTAVECRLPSGRLIRAATPPLVPATKLAAWVARARRPPPQPRIHDLIVLADGRPELGDDLAAQTSSRARCTGTASCRAIAPPRRADA